MIETTTTSVSYATNGSRDDFDYGFKISEDADLVVVYIDSAGASTTLALNTDYTVTGAGDDAGGTVTCVTPPAASGTLRISRTLALTQPYDLRNQGAFLPATHEAALDRIVMLVQQISDDLSGLSSLPASAIPTRYTSVNPAAEGGRPTAAAAYAGQWCRLKITGQSELVQICLETASAGVYEWTTVGVANF